jgi:hypothetical protein
MSLTLTPSVRLLWMSDQFIAMNTRDEHLSSAGFETASPAVKRLQTYASDDAVPGMGSPY